jgi:epoxyqueuosine reductase
MMLKAKFDKYNKVASSPFASCLFHSNGTCRACIKRCPSGAITFAGHNAKLCREQCAENRKLAKDEYNLDMGACALCLCGVPCSKKTP